MSEAIEAAFAPTDHDSVELLRAMATMEGPPYFIYREDGKPDTRLKRALEIVQKGKVEPQADGTFLVQGTTQVYTCNTECSCKQGQYGKSKWCWHMCAVKLYKEWQARLGKPIPSKTPQNAPESHQGETVSEQAPKEPTVEDAADYEPAGTDTPPTHSVALTLPVVTSDLECSITEWTHQRQLLTRYIKDHMRLGVDFYTLKMEGRETKPAISKAGAEKFLSLFHLHASFHKDGDTWEMLGSPVGLLCYVCILSTSSGEVVGEGRGARDIKKDRGDVNKAIKMGQKSALCDAVLRTGALSDLFTQDAEDDDEKPEASPAVVKVDYRREIMRLLDTMGVPAGDREHYRSMVHELTGMALEPANYPQIVEQLKAQVQARNGVTA